MGIRQMGADTPEADMAERENGERGRFRHRSISSGHIRRGRASGCGPDTDRCDDADRWKRRLIFDDRVAAYVARRLNHAISLTPPYSCVGVERNGRIIAGAVFNGWTGPDIELTIAVDHGGLTRGFMRAMADYAFRQCGCVRASFTTTNPRAVTVLTKLGGRIEGVKRNAYGPGCDAVQIGILKEELALR